MRTASRARWVIGKVQQFEFVLYNFGKLISKMVRLIVLLLVVALTGEVCAAESADGPDDIMRAAIATPKPDYPYVARYHYIQGAGIYIVRLHTPAGLVKQVTVAKSSGSSLLDQAAVAGLKKWRFKPGAVAPMQQACPGIQASVRN